MNKRCPESNDLTFTDPHDPIPGASLKPPTQVAGVQGIAPVPIVPPAPPERIDWKRLVSLPPFQMFAAEHGAGPYHGQPEREITEWLGQADLQVVFGEYCQWHKAKGLWPNETPYGRIKHPVVS